MTFDLDKKNALNKKDLSAKGCLDKRMKSLVGLINSKKDYYSSSSCSGRILLLKLAHKKRKKLSVWPFVSHEKTDAGDVFKALKDLPEEEVWFKMEPMILHVCCRTVNDASALLDKANKAGLKHSGIISIRKKVVVEVFGNERIDCIVARSRQLLVPKAYIKVLVGYANKLLAVTHEKIKLLERLF